MYLLYKLIYYIKAKDDDISMRKLNFKSLFFVIIIILAIHSLSRSAYSKPLTELPNNFPKTMENLEPATPFNRKIVYLTFDDGPTPKITDKLLDILDTYQVKSTFFVVGKEIIGREKILKRIYDEGHSIGLHTYTHNVNKIYLCPEIFIEEMLKTREKIKEITGFESNILRFPWGSTNQYYKLDTNMVNQLHQHNLKIYDWNASIEDGLYPGYTTSELLKNARKIKDDYPNIILLMHCNSSNINTVKALAAIIEHYKSLGYAFDKITEETLEYYYPLKKKP